VSPEWLKAKEAAAYVGVTTTTLYRWCKAGILPYHELRTGGGRRFLAEDLDKLLTKGQPEEREDPDALLEPRGLEEL
jgi:excisionase family DNA binding protein